MVQRTRRYLIRRVVVVLLTLFVVTLLSFLLMRLSPIDPATAYVKRNSAIVTQEQIDEARVMLGLDKPLPVQYFDWVPGFYLGTAFIDLFAVRLGWISVSGNSGFTRYFPVALCLSVLGICFYGQMLAASLEREMEQDYAMYLRCRGLREGRILLFHAFPHAVVDLLPSFAQMLGLCLANAAIVERVFSLSGLGYLIIDAVVKRDSPVIHAAVLVLALTLVLLDTAAELLQYGLRSDMRAVGGRA